MSNEDPQWLDPAQQNAWRALVSVVTRLPAALDTQMQRDSDMTHFEYFVLALLSEHPERRLRLNALAAEANASLSRLSHVVTRLEKRGWVRREPVPGSRGSHAVLTDAGYDTVVEAAPSHVKAVRRLVFDGLDDNQVRALARLGSALVEQIDEGIAGGIGKA
ncbi:MULTISPECIES: MarR family winged helix-turn-helix transcriptional regulator [Rhodococcus]|uniref:MarR family winged helix-turn-helix transcriptional regulator n=1 Tax=Rhodococcus TaxID=1827 RepID=UPI0020CE01EB|nr:MarR family transcriptional regulator [Rhodococcus sp. GA1]